eukprot:6203590-Pleurochrysis_carterae.AAC.1
MCVDARLRARLHVCAHARLRSRACVRSRACASASACARLRLHSLSERHVEDHHEDEAEHEPLHGEALVAVRLHLGHQRVGNDEDHRARRERHGEGQQRTAVVREGGAEQAAHWLDHAGEL